MAVRHSGPWASARPVKLRESSIGSGSYDTCVNPRGSPPSIFQKGFSYQLTRKSNREFPKTPKISEILYGVCKRKKRVPLAGKLMRHALFERTGAFVIEVHPDGGMRLVAA